MSEWRGLEHLGSLVGGWVLLSLGAAIVGLGALSAMPYWVGESCSMAAIGFLFSLPIGVPSMLLGAFMLWAAEGALASSQTGTSRGTRPGGVLVDVAAFLVSAVLALVVAFTLGDPLVRHKDGGLALGVLSVLACAVVLWAERRRLRRA